MAFRIASRDDEERRPCALGGAGVTYNTVIVITALYQNPRGVASPLPRLALALGLVASCDRALALARAGGDLEELGRHTGA